MKERKVETMACRLKILQLAVVLIVIFAAALYITTTSADAYSETDVVYTDENIIGGNIYFDKSTGTVTDCDDSVTAAVIPEKIEGVEVTSIGKSAFELCRKLESVTLPDTVDNIGECAFNACMALKSVNIPEHVKKLFTYTFKECSALTYIQIPAEVEELTYSAFIDCSSLTVIDVDPNNSHFSSVDGVLFDESMEWLYKYPAGKTGAKYTIPSETRHTVSYAFADNQNLEEVVFPDGFEILGASSFHGCTSLKTVDLPEGIIRINDSAFSECPSLESISIPESVTQIGNFLFKNCSSLRNISLGKNVNSIARDAFLGCTSLEAVNVSGDNSKYVSEDGVLYDKAKSTLIKYPANRPASGFSIPETVTTIGHYSFSDNQNLVSIDIPETVITLESDAFYKASITKVTIPGTISEIGSYAFSSCKMLSTVTMENGVENIGQGAFGYNYALKEMSLPESITQIGNEVFYYCNHLEKISIPSGVTTIGTGVFRNCNNLTIYCDEGSVAEAYAESNSISVKSLSDPEAPEVIQKEKREIQVNSSFNKEYGDAEFSLGAEAVTQSGENGILAGNELQYFSRNKSVAEVSENGTVAVKAAGSTVIEIRAAETSRFKEAYAEVTINVAKASQPELTSAVGYNKVYGDKPFTISIPAMTRVYFSSSNSDIVAVTPVSDTSAQVTIKSGGKAVIKAEAEETANYQGRIYEIPIGVAKASQAVTCNSTFNKVFEYDGSFYLNARSMTGKTYKSSNTKIATVLSSGKVIMKNPGKVTITITAAATSQYNSASKSVTFTSALKKPVLKAKAYKGRKVKLTWDKVPGAHGYKVYFYNAAKKKYVCGVTKKAFVKSVTHKGLKKGKTYKYKIRAYRIVNGKVVYSSYSTVKSVKVKK